MRLYLIRVRQTEELLIGDLRTEFVLSQVGDVERRAFSLIASLTPSILRRGFWHPLLLSLV